MDRILVVTPFLHASTKLKELLAGDEFKGIKCGTVHTAQGQERDIVFFVLGGNPSTGARAWASSKPNLFNVAVSRAKRKIYVIGDRDVWSTHRYFSELAPKLRPIVA